jgi:pimeloyl-ACP methyl ester carboxylesterase
VLLSAGLGGTAGYWTPQLAALRERYRVVAYDQAGTGRNRRDLPADHSIAQMADEVLAVLDATGTAVCHFVGHALGGLAGLDLAVRRSGRLQSLTVVNGWAAAHAHTRRCFEARLALLMAARDDVLVPSSVSEELAAAIEGATLHIAPWGAHAVNVTQPESFNFLLLDFLDRQAGLGP